MRDEPVLAGIELGGTKTIAVLARGGAIVERLRVATTTPDETLGAIAARLATWQPAAIGIASFGPVAIRRGDPRFGQILATPKPGWQGADLIAALAPSLPVERSAPTSSPPRLPKGDDGAAAGLSDFVYVTIGTGIGMGIVSGGRALTGRLHPEAGHMRVPRLAGDDFRRHLPVPRRLPRRTRQRPGDRTAGRAAGEARSATTTRPGGSSSTRWPRPLPTSA